MDYQVFEMLGDSRFAQQEAEEGQAYMERVFRRVFGSSQEEDGEQITEHVYELMRSRFVSCSFQERTLDMEFVVRQWELNPMGNLHGGILVTAVDMACGILTRFYRQTKAVSTVHLSVDFLRPIKCGETFIVRAKLNKSGRRIAFLTAEAFLKKDGRTAATASGTFV